MSKASYSPEVFAAPALTVDAFLVAVTAVVVVVAVVTLVTLVVEFAAVESPVVVRAVVDAAPLHAVDGEK